MKFGDFELGKYRFKQEEIGSILLAATIWIWVFDFLLPIKDSFLRREKIYVVVSNIIVLVFLLALFVLSNRQTFRCYYLTRKKRAIVKAKIVNTRVYWEDKTSIYLVVRFKILETGEVYQWSESFSTAPEPARIELHKYLDSLPEIDVLVALNNHDENYPLIQIIFNDFVRQSQKMFRILNVFWLVLFVISFIYVYGKYFNIL